MKSKNKRLVLAAAMTCVLAWTAHAAESDKEKQQKEVRNMAQETLQRLYKAEPKTKQWSLTRLATRPSATWE
jgi:ABC-type transporter MlaC component